MIHVLMSRIKLCLISRKVTGSQTRLQDKSVQETKLLPAKIGCQSRMPAKKRQNKNGCYPKLAVKIGCQKKCTPTVVTGFKWGQKMCAMHCQIYGTFYKKNENVFSKLEMVAREKLTLVGETLCV